MKKVFHRLVLASAVTTLMAAPAMAAPVTYTVDDSHTFADFSYNHMGLSQQLNTFDKTSGTVVLDLEAKTGEVDITIDTTSVNTGHEGFNEHIQGEDFLDTAQFPTATFTSTNVIFEEDTPKAVEGNLTIKGITKPVTLEITHFNAIPHPMLKKPALGANATANIKRSDFNADKFAPAVSDEVTLTISFEGIAAD